MIGLGALEACAGGVWMSVQWLIDILNGLHAMSSMVQLGVWLVVGLMILWGLAWVWRKARPGMAELEAAIAQHTKERAALNRTIPPLEAAVAALERTEAGLRDRLPETALEQAAWERQDGNVEKAIPLLETLLSEAGPPVALACKRVSAALRRLPPDAPDADTGNRAKTCDRLDRLAALLAEPPGAGPRDSSNGG